VVERRASSAVADDELALHLEGITKRFPRVVANDRVDFDVRRGEVHALLGQNGAGKSTLAHIVSGLYRPDQGVIRLFGKRVEMKSPGEALDRGIGMVHQHFRLVPSLTVAENVVLGHEKAGRLFKLTESDLRSRVADLSARHNLPVDPGTPVWQLSIGEQQRVELLKALYRQARILILDEPTAVLTPQETDSLFDTVREMVDRGRSVILISHKLDEVMAVSDRITVLREGKKVGTWRTADVDARSLSRMMVGRDINLSRKPPEGVRPPSVTPLIELCGVSADGDRGSPALHDISLQVREGEILGVAGVAGNGQRELAEVIAGLRRPSVGTIRIRGNDRILHAPKDAIRLGIGYVPDDRLGTGLAPNVTVAENLALKAYSREPFSWGPFLRREQIGTHARVLMEQYDVRGGTDRSPVRSLSGGNIQKLLLAREIASRPEALVAVSPTRGLDIAATQSVRTLIAELATSGRAILLISEDLDEILTLADRIAVLYEGRIVGTADPSAVQVEELGLMMAGASG